MARVEKMYAVARGGVLICEHGARKSFVKLYGTEAEASHESRMMEGGEPWLKGLGVAEVTVAWKYRGWAKHSKEELC